MARWDRIRRAAWPCLERDARSGSGCQVPGAAGVVSDDWLQAALADARWFRSPHIDRLMPRGYLVELFD